MIEEGDLVIVYDSSLNHQHNSIRKFGNRWFEPYEVRKMFDNGTYRLCELDGAILQVPMTGKRVKIFKKRADPEPYVTLYNTDTEEQSDNNHRGTKSEESGLELIIDIGGETDSATDEGE